jgi:hypothetical protein
MKAIYWVQSTFNILKTYRYRVGLELGIGVGVRIKYRGLCICSSSSSLFNAHNPFCDINMISHMQQFM